MLDDYFPYEVPKLSEQEEKQKKEKQKNEQKDEEDYDADDIEGNDFYNHFSFATPHDNVHVIWGMLL